MMRWPRSLFGRSVLLLVLLLVASQVLWLAIFRSMVQVPRLERLATYMLDQEALLQQALGAAPPAERAALLHALAGRQGTRLVAANLAANPAANTMTAEIGRGTNARFSMLIAPLRSALGPQRQVHWQRDGDQRIWINTHIAGEDYWLGFPVAGLLPATGRLLVLGSAATLLLSLVGAWLIQRQIRRPLRELTDASAAVAEGRLASALPVDAPLEIATVAASFMRMTASLERAEQERTLMLAGVSHDLRTPLAKLRLCIEMLRAEADASLIESMVRSIDSADAVIGQFIDYARIGCDEGGQWGDPCELATSVAQEYAGRCDCQIRLVTEEVEPLLMRPVALRRAIANLVGNACHYAGGEIVLQVRATGQTLCIETLDRGPGIPAAELTRLRQPFARLAARRGNVTGAGLGLAIVERIAALHHGRLVLTNRADGGLAATLELPLTPLPAQTAAI